MNTNRLKTLLLSVLLLTALSGCGKDKTDKEESIDAKESSSVSDTAEDTKESKTESDEEKTTSAEKTQEKTEEPTEAVVYDYDQIYNKTIEDFRTAIKEGVTDDTDILGDPTVLNELAYLQDQQYLGYAVTDISGDNIPELLIGGIDEYKDGIGYGDQIFVVYTCVGDEIVMSFEGAYRSSYQYAGGNCFFHQGSGGAMYSMFGKFSLLPNATEMEWSEYYFTHPKDETYQEIGLYFNTSGEMDVSASEEIDITDDEFWAKQTSMADDTEYIELTPFVEEDAAPSQLFVEYQSDASFNEDSCDFYSVDKSGYETLIVFSTDGVLQDLKLLSLFMNDVDGEGNPEYTIDEIYSYGTLESYRPLMVELTFYGDMPNYGVSYTDETGETKYFAISVSGYDGALELLAF